MHAEASGKSVTRFAYRMKQKRTLLPSLFFLSCIMLYLVQLYDRTGVVTIGKGSGIPLTGSHLFFYMYTFLGFFLAFLLVGATIFYVNLWFSKFRYIILTETSLNLPAAFPGEEDKVIPYTEILAVIAGMTREQKQKLAIIQHQRGREYIVRRHFIYKKDFDAMVKMLEEKVHSSRRA